MTALEPPNTADLAKEVTDLKRKLRLIKRKIQDPTEQNLRQAMYMIDDAFCGDETEKSKQNGLLRSTASSRPIVPLSTLRTDEKKPIITTSTQVQASTETLDAFSQTLQRPKTSTIETQTTISGEIGVRNEALMASTQSSIQKAIDILTNTKSNLNEDKPFTSRRSIEGEGTSLRKLCIPMLKPISPTAAARGSSASSQMSMASSSSVPTTAGRPPAKVQLQRIQQETIRSQNRLSSVCKIAIGDGADSNSNGARSSLRRGTSSIESAVVVPEKRKKSNSETIVNCKNCKFKGARDALFYHNCKPAEFSKNLECCGKTYLTYGNYMRHRSAVRR
ncbi:hypothetical protein PFISCL1PPCAC_6610, partial [Pristionchus fissidentatus]